MKKLFTAIRASDLEMLKTGNTAIANYLLDMGADVNFIEDETCCNAWRTPVLHDAINCAVMLCKST